MTQYMIMTFGVDTARKITHLLKGKSVDGGGGRSLHRPPLLSTPPLLWASSSPFSPPLTPPSTVSPPPLPHLNLPSAPPYSLSLPATASLLLPLDIPSPPPSINLQLHSLPSCPSLSAQPTSLSLSLLSLPPCSKVI